MGNSCNRRCHYVLLVLIITTRCSWIPMLLFPLVLGIDECYEQNSRIKFVTKRKILPSTTSAPSRCLNTTTTPTASCCLYEICAVMNFKSLPCTNNTNVNTNTNTNTFVKQNNNTKVINDHSTPIKQNDNTSTITNLISRRSKITETAATTSTTTNSFESSQNEEKVKTGYNTIKRFTQCKTVTCGEVVQFIFSDMNDEYSTNHQQKTDWIDYVHTVQDHSVSGSSTFNYNSSSSTGCTKDIVSECVWTITASQCSSCNDIQSTDTRTNIQNLHDKDLAVTSGSANIRSLKLDKKKILGATILDFKNIFNEEQKSQSSKPSKRKSNESPLLDRTHQPILLRPVTKPINERPSTTNERPSTTTNEPLVPPLLSSLFRGIKRPGVLSSISSPVHRTPTLSRPLPLPIKNNNKPIYTSTPVPTNKQSNTPTTIKIPSPSPTTQDFTTKPIKNVNFPNNIQKTIVRGKTRPGT